MVTGDGLQSGLGARFSNVHITVTPEHRNILEHPGTPPKLGTSTRKPGTPPPPKKNPEHPQENQEHLPKKKTGTAQNL